MADGQPTPAAELSVEQRRRLLARVRAQLRAGRRVALAAGADPSAWTATLASTLAATRRRLADAPPPGRDRSPSVSSCRGHDASSSRLRAGTRKGAAVCQEELAERLADLTAEVTAVRQLIAAAEERAAARERTIDRLYADMERLRSGDRHLAVRPFLVDLQRLRDDLLRQAAALPAEVTAVQVAAWLESFAYSTEQSLARGGVEVLRPEIGSPFDASRQRAAGVVPASRAELDGTVAEVLSDGYLDTTVDRALTSATVRLYRCGSDP